MNRNEGNIDQIEDEVTSSIATSKTSSTIQSYENLNDLTIPISATSKTTSTMNEVRRRRDRHRSDGRKWKRRRSENSGRTPLITSFASSSSSSSAGNSSISSCSSSSCSSSGSSSSSDGEDDEVNDNLVNSAKAIPISVDSSIPFGTASADQSTIANTADHMRDQSGTNNPLNGGDESTTFNSSPISQDNAQPLGWRVKLYRLNSDGSWDDCGTGRITCSFAPDQSKLHALDKATSFTSDALGETEDSIYKELGEPQLSMRAELPQKEATDVDNDDAEVSKTKFLLKSRILLREAYQRQGDNIITWCEPFFCTPDNLSEGTSTNCDSSMDYCQGVDLALSFQDNAGCLDIWKQITEIQAHAVDLFEKKHGNNIPQLDTSSLDAAEGAMHHILPLSHGTDSTLNEPSNEEKNEILNKNDSLKSNQFVEHHQQNLWDNVTATGHHNSATVTFDNGEAFLDASVDFVNATTNLNPNTLLQQSHSGLMMDQMSLTPQLPTPSLQNLEEVADLIATAQVQQREQLSLFFSSNDCMYLMCLLKLFPSAEEKDNPRALATLAACVKSILLLNDPTLIELVVNDENIFNNICGVLEYDPDLRSKANHRCFLKEQVKFCTVVYIENDKLITAIQRAFRVSYLRDTLLRPTMDESSLSTLASLLQFTHGEIVRDVTCPPSSNSSLLNNTLDEQGTLIPCQDSEKSFSENDSYLVKIMQSLGSDLRAIHGIERRMTSSVPMSHSPQQSTASFAKGNGTHTKNGKQHLLPQDNSLSSRKIRRKGALIFLKELFTMFRNSLQPSAKDDVYNMIMLLDVELSKDERESCTLGNDMAIDVVEESIADNINLLYILGSVLSDYFAEASDKSNALEILNAIVIHDPTLVRRHCLTFFSSKKGERPKKPVPNEKNQVVFSVYPNDLLLCLLFLIEIELDAGVLLQASEILRTILDTEMMEQSPITACIDDGVSRSTSGSDQNSFLTMFYENYVQWLTIPFQHQIIVEVHDNQLTQVISECKVRSCFIVELLSFCVRAHCSRMKSFVLRNNILGVVLRLLTPPISSSSLVIGEGNGDRCLILAVLRFLRSALSVKDEFYYRHIVQNNLFELVFEAFRANPVGDNLVASSVAEMCDFIRTENIETLLDHIVTRHLHNGAVDTSLPSLEEVATPYVDTFNLMRKQHSENSCPTKSNYGSTENGVAYNIFDSCTSSPKQGFRVNLNTKALEDQRKFREIGEEDSYFKDADDDNLNKSLSSSTLQGNFHPRENDTNQSNPFHPCMGISAPNVIAPSNETVLHSSTQEPLNKNGRNMIKSIDEVEVK